MIEDKPDHLPLLDEKLLDPLVKWSPAAVVRLRVASVGRVGARKEFGGIGVDARIDSECSWAAEVASLVE
jgi:hypothetical protein